MPRLGGLAPRCSCKVIAGRGIQKCPRGVHDNRRIGSPACAHCGHRVATLGAHARDQQRQGGGYRAHTFNFCRIGCAYNQPELAIEVPGALRQSGDVFIEQRLAFDGGEALVLQVIATGVGGAAQQNAPLPAYLTGLR